MAFPPELAFLIHFEKRIPKEPLWPGTNMAAVGSEEQVGRELVRSGVPVEVALVKGPPGSLAAHHVGTP
jgi:hypothetical protein